jgi:hypothetical protein
VTLCSLFSYFPFLFGQTPVPLVFVSLALLVPVAVVLRDYALALFSAPLGQDGRLLTAIEESDTLAPGLGGVFAVEKQPKNVGL